MADEIKDPVDEPEVNAIEMSDEEFANLPEPVLEVEDAAADTTPVDQSGDTDSVGDDSDPAEEDAEAETADDEVVDGTEGEQDSEADGDAPKEPEAKKSDPPADAGVDYKTEYERLTAPFKANGVDIQVKSTEEIISLMQMGANYHKKMASLKPAMKVMKLLERHDLMDESKLSYLIDLSKKNPAAITKLIKDSGLDPMAIDTEAASTYTPQTPGISDSEMELEGVLEAIQETPTYAKTLKVVSETWDDASRNAIAASPQIISIINEHIGNGVFDKVYSEVQRARSFGKLNGVSDFEAYKTMGDLMHSQGLLAPPSAPASVNVEPAVSAQKKETDDKRKAAKKAATITTGKTTPPVKQPENLLALSDDAFEKLPVSAYTKVK